MARRRALFAIATGLALALASHAADAAAKIKIGFLPGVVDPFYQVMQIGVETAAKDLGVEVQTPILDSMIARGDLNYASDSKSAHHAVGRSQGEHGQT